MTDQSSPTEDQIIEVLRTVMDPELHKDLVTLGMVKDVGQTGNVVDDEELRHVVHYCRGFDNSHLQPGGQPC